ncbi:MAG TPA: hypothetical protein VFU07_10805 [Candidatus Lumbricidophila sp.]|nr:hypothetical protein [Candidatus Lumbricidophila sp.]
MRLRPQLLLSRRALGFGAAVAFAITGTAALAPLTSHTPLPAAAGAVTSDARVAPDPIQVLSFGAFEAANPEGTEAYVARTGPMAMIESGTNWDWAKLVLFFGDFPLTDENVTVMVRWMRQENGPDDWFNRNNPLNNGLGSGGGSGLGSYATLVDAAKYAAKMIHRPLFAGIAAQLQNGTSADATAAAIWASPWASSHYANGAHWSTRPVPVIEAPAAAWGR